jgi:hypothetical protein
MLTYVIDSECDTDSTPAPAIVYRSLTKVNFQIASLILFGHSSRHCPSKTHRFATPNSQISHCIATSVNVVVAILLQSVTCQQVQQVQIYFEKVT